MKTAAFCIPQNNIIGITPKLDLVSNWKLDLINRISFIVVLKSEASYYAGGCV